MLLILFHAALNPLPSPMQRVPRYRMLLEDLLKHTDAGHPDEAPMRKALSEVQEVALLLNESKRETDALEQLRRLVERFAPAEREAMAAELVRYDRTLRFEGPLLKARRAHRQRRHCFLFSDLMLYAREDIDGLVPRGRITLTAETHVTKLADSSQVQSAQQ